MALRACFLVFTVTRGRFTPKELQLDAGISAMNGKETFVIARTGWGKTLCIAIPLLLCPDKITVTITPLKRLQAMQVSDFLNKFCIRTVAINEDTPDDKDLWSAISDGHISHLIATPEQFSMQHGHLPKLARLLHKSKFVSRIARLVVDECHNLFTAGSSRNNRKAFRPAYGNLSQLRTRLNKDTSLTLLSATVPSHIFNHINSSLALRPNPTVIRVSTNRPNLVYARHILVNGRHDLRNLDMIVPAAFHPPMRLPTLLIFFGVKIETSAAAQQYLDQVYSDFADPEGRTLILCATAGAGEEVTTKTQWEGRGGRSTDDEAFCVSMIEPWVAEIDSSTLIIDSNDPDRPLQDISLTKKNPTKQERTGRASIHFAVSDECERVLKAAYYGDDSAEALYYTGRWCCDSKAHVGSTFELQKLFLGSIYEEQPVVPTAAKRRRNVYRPTRDRPLLEELLGRWRFDVHRNFHLRAVRPPTFILDAPHIKKLAMAAPDSINSAESITTLLKQTEEWAGLWADVLFKLVSGYTPVNGDDEEEGPRAKRRKA
ncbi:P-loop containing nucleoside triphosphate hydrolase protein [Favolaschia claudopus]|uniref:P-loop containing nucleoside triphosphate hydrolase protein n=1 Tax=Favolaschia claudopus TaxID=2862362 RepID=A0AAW0C8D6_9AGAR